MIPYAITPSQAAIAESYWGKSWTFLSADQVQEALDFEREDRHLAITEWLTFVDLIDDPPRYR